jgi:diadenosine tetraphosphate (Ap4A) HIT family hydrolase
MACPFCSRVQKPEEVSNELVESFADAYPLTTGHSLVVPRRHVASIFDLSEREYQILWATVWQVRQALESEYNPDGFNIGVNDGAASGQTIEHAHVHVIPRYSGDISDPRGGVRWILPERARYWVK